MPPKTAPFFLKNSGEYGRSPGERFSAMKTIRLQPFPFVILSIAAFITTPAATAEDKPAAPVPESEKPAEKQVSGNELLKTAVTAMSDLKSYHAGGTFSAGERTATISGDFGVGTVDMQVLGFDGKIAFRRGVKDKFFISHDSGKSWEEDPAKDMTSLLSLAVTSPLNVKNKLWEQGEFEVVGGEKLDEEEVLHLQKPASDNEPAMDFWLAKDAKLGLVIRRASFVISADDGDFPVVMAYTDLNKPAEIAAPVIPEKKGGKKEKRPARN